MSIRDKAINQIIEIEGGYVNNPDDSGGATNFGITEKAARDYGYAGDMRDLPRNLAFDIYADKYWNSLNLTTIEKMSPVIAGEVVDTGVNQGTHRAALFLQRALNVLNKKGKLYHDLTVDGQIGQASIRALGEYLAHRPGEGEKVLLRMLNSLQGAFYIELAERREKEETFIYGWFKHRIVI